MWCVYVCVCVCIRVSIVVHQSSTLRTVLNRLTAACVRARAVYTAHRLGRGDRPRQARVEEVRVGMVEDAFCVEGICVLLRAGRDTDEWVVVCGGDLRGGIPRSWDDELHAR